MKTGDDLFGMMADLVRADVARMSGEQAAARMSGMELAPDNRVLSCLFCGEVLKISRELDDHVCPTA